MCKLVLQFYVPSLFNDETNIQFNITDIKIWKKHQFHIISQILVFAKKINITFWHKIGHQILCYLLRNILASSIIQFNESEVQLNLETGFFVFFCHKNDSFVTILRKYINFWKVSWFFLWWKSSNCQLVRKYWNSWRWWSYRPVFLFYRRTEGYFFGTCPEHA